jgi:hypothetical protein
MVQNYKTFSFQDEILAKSGHWADINYKSDKKRRLVGRL